MLKAKKKKQKFKDNPRDLMKLILIWNLSIGKWKIQLNQFYITKDLHAKLVTYLVGKIEQ